MKIHNFQRKYIILLSTMALFILLAWIPSPLKAQNHVQFNYDVSVPLGNTNDFITQTSPRGFSLSAGHNFTPHFGLGVKAGLQSFYEELSKDTYTEDNVTLYGKQFRYINSIPILVHAHYHFLPEARANPYVALGVGAYSFQKRIDLGLYTTTNEFVWNFGLQPEVGILLPLADKMKINVNARYNHVFANQSIDVQSYLSIGVGLFFGTLLDARDVPTENLY